MNRITTAQLENLVKRINERTGSPLTTYTKNKDGATRANIGNYYLDWAYGGVKLDRVCNEGGGVNSISNAGFGTKRELYNWMQAFLMGLSDNK